jgi:hypothetical protein
MPFAPRLLRTFSMGASTTGVSGLFDKRNEMSLRGTAAHRTINFLQGALFGSRGK